MATPAPHSQSDAKVTAEAFLAAVTSLPEAQEWGLQVESVAHGDIRLRLPFSERFLRPGGTISGPVMFGLCDTALWGASWSVTGAGIGLVTADMTLHFLRRPRPADLLAHGRVLRAGRTLIYERSPCGAQGRTTRCVTRPGRMPARVSPRARRGRIRLPPPKR